MRIKISHCGTDGLSTGCIRFEVILENFRGGNCLLISSTVDVLRHDYQASEKAAIEIADKEREMLYQAYKVSGHCEMLHPWWMIAEKIREIVNASKPCAVYL